MTAPWVVGSKGSGLGLGGRSRTLPTYRRLLAVLFVAGLATGAPGGLQAQTADLILTGARVWTGDSTNPTAQAVAIARDRILAVGTAAEIARLAGSATRTIELRGRFISPGFIDNHTHFSQAGALLLGVNLLDVADEVGLISRVREARDRMPEGAWLVGGDWGAYEAWAQGSTGREGAAARQPFAPTRALIDSITPDTPALLSKWDRSAYLANGKALSLAGAVCGWPGVECRDGQATGRLDETAANRVRSAIPTKPMTQRQAEGRVALEQLSSYGVTTIHDITGFDQLAVYQELQRRGALTTRIFARPTMDNVDRLLEMGILPGFGDDLIRIGGLKGFVDGIMGNSSARFYQPYLTSGKLGEWRVMMNPPGNMARLLKTADSVGYWPMVHAIGDHGIDTLLTMFEETMRVNGDKPRRFRLIHTQVIRDAAVAERMARLGVIAEVQPYHAIDDMRWMEERIGGRSRWAYAFRTLQQAGVLLSFGSDWPGTNAAWYTADPIKGMYAAVTRQTLEGEPAAGWFPEERVDLETALRGYTVNNAWAEGAEDRKGRLASGYLADVVVWDADPFTGSGLRDRRIVLTVLAGRIVYQARP